MSDTNFTPVFVAGAARSGTTMVARVVSSHRQFHKYKAESLILNVCQIKYGNIFSNIDKRGVFLSDWSKSRQHRESGISIDEFSSIIESSRSYAELLVKFLRAMTSQSNTDYIVDSTPGNLLFFRDLNRLCPHSKFIHVVRDGRDVAISQAKLNWSNPPYPYKSYEDKLHYGLVQWEMNIKSSESQSKHVHILTVKYEDILKAPEEFRNKVSSFLNLVPQEFSLSAIENQPVANSAFGKLGTEGNASSVQRWKSLDDAILKNICYGVNKTLNRNGYEQYPSYKSFLLFIRYIFFKIHIKAKRLLRRFPIIGRMSTQSLEFDN